MSSSSSSSSSSSKAAAAAAAAAEAEASKTAESMSSASAGSKSTSYTLDEATSTDSAEDSAAAAAAEAKAAAAAKQVQRQREQAAVRAALTSIYTYPPRPGTKYRERRKWIEANREVVVTNAETDKEKELPPGTTGGVAGAATADEVAASTCSASESEAYADSNDESNGYGEYDGYYDYDSYDGYYDDYDYSDLGYAYSDDDVEAAMANTIISAMAEADGGIGVMGATGATGDIGTIGATGDTGAIGIGMAADTTTIALCIIATSGTGATDGKNPNKLPRDLFTRPRSAWSVNDKSFYRRVYLVVVMQLAVVAVMGSIFFHSPGVHEWIQERWWLLYVNLALSIGVLLMWFCCFAYTPVISHLLFSLFTILDAALIGFIAAFYDSSLVLQGVLVTGIVFVVLTLVTFNTRYDFSQWGSMLSAMLIILIFGSIVRMFFPGNSLLGFVLTMLGVFVFCGYIMYDTWKLRFFYTPDEYLFAAMDLYLDITRLFVYIMELCGEMTFPSTTNVNISRQYRGLNGIGTDGCCCCGNAACDEGCGPVVIDRLSIICNCCECSYLACCTDVCSDPSGSLQPLCDCLDCFVQVFAYLIMHCCELGCLVVEAFA
ncbi:bax Inhibitor family protein [Thecamonas trahens ATCC 50062]|uniref:Bax Inhibitor family protein n=1 Tax=Thecamonas trahens ATCC 50062 TaxID=461836 RepID=A0A0L0DHY2_THETB|nr:bax Inhibitor family protein [Thecamonas trahens ATCC 50062]KNC51835.1 bax Inhibitor family protein [Thecamonas trahens ATCC 50062]|eukprot:XP_013755700.1 bax Inhibitor family protein [Thecamonas trahens ATCC 50062]